MPICIQVKTEATAVRRLRSFPRDLCQVAFKNRARRSSRGEQRPHLLLRKQLVPVWIQDGDRRGSEAAPPASGYPGVLEVRRGGRRSDKEGIHLKANRR